MLKVQLMIIDDECALESQRKKLTSNVRKQMGLGTESSMPRAEFKEREKQQRKEERRLNKELKKLNAAVQKQKSVDRSSISAAASSTEDKNKMPTLPLTQKLLTSCEDAVRNVDFSDLGADAGTEIKDTALRAISLAQLELIITHMRNRLAAGEVWAVKKWDEKACLLPLLCPFEQSRLI